MLDLGEGGAPTTKQGHLGETTELVSILARICYTDVKREVLGNLTKTNISLWVWKGVQQKKNAETTTTGK